MTVKPFILPNNDTKLIEQRDTSKRWKIRHASMENASSSITSAGWKWAITSFLLPTLQKMAFRQVSNLKYIETYL